MLELVTRIIQALEEGEKVHRANRPETIRYYNDYMRGIDLMDCLISCYSMALRTTRWPAKVILYLFTRV